MESPVTLLTAAQRVDMLMKGLNARDPVEVKKYLQGYGISQKDRIERAKIMFEGASNLGGANERDIEPQIGDDPEVYEKMIDRSRQNPIHSEQNLRRQLQDELGDYEVEQPRPPVRRQQRPQQQPQRPQQRRQLNEVDDGNFDEDGFVAIPTTKSTGDLAHDGFEAAREYLNAFVKNFLEANVQNSYNRRKAMFDALQACLQMEARYKHDAAALQKFRSGVLKAEKAMFQKLQGQTK